MLTTPWPSSSAKTNGRDFSVISGPWLGLSGHLGLQILSLLIRPGPMLCALPVISLGSPHGRQVQKWGHDPKWPEMYWVKIGITFMIGFSWYMFHYLGNISQSWYFLGSWLCLCVRYWLLNSTWYGDWNINVQWCSKHNSMLTRVIMYASCMIMIYMWMSCE